MSARSRAIRSPLWALALLPGCFSPPIHYASQEVLIRHDATADTLDVLILYDGIQAVMQGDKNAGVDIGRTFAQHVATGRREFLLFDWPFHADLDRVRDDVDRHAQDAKDPWAGYEREWIRPLEEIRVASSGFYADAENRLSIHQRFRIEHAKNFIALVERALHIAVAESAGAGTLAADLPELDEPTRAAWAKLAKEKIPWLSLSGGGIEVVLPMTSTCAVGLLKRIAEQCAHDSFTAKISAALTSSLDDLRISEDRLRLRFAGKDGSIRFRVDGEEDYDSSLSDELRKPKDFPQKLPSREEVIRAFSGS